jgi:hypothetical protein
MFLFALVWNRILLVPANDSQPRSRRETAKPATTGTFYQQVPFENIFALHI